MDFLGKIIAAIWVFIEAFFHQRARDQFVEEQKEKSKTAEQEREEIEKDVAQRPDEQLDKDLNKWMRD